MKIFRKDKVLAAGLLGFGMGFFFCSAHFQQFLFSFIKLANEQLIGLYSEVNLYLNYELFEQL